MFVYLIAADGCGTIKIGKANDPDARLAQLQIGSPLELRLLRKIQCGTEGRAYIIEKIAHDALKEFLVRGEWYSLPNKEWTSRLIQLLLICAKGEPNPIDLDSAMKTFALKTIETGRRRLHGIRKRRKRKSFTKDQMYARM